MISRKINILKTIVSFILYILITYVFTGIGYSSQIMPLCNMPIWLGNIFICFILPIFVYLSLTQTVKKTK